MCDIIKYWFCEYLLQQLQKAIIETQKNAKIEIVEETPYGNLVSLFFFSNIMPILHIYIHLFIDRKIFTGLWIFFKYNANIAHFCLHIPMSIIKIFFCLFEFWKLGKQTNSFKTQSQTSTNGFDLSVKSLRVRSIFASDGRRRVWAWRSRVLGERRRGFLSVHGHQGYLCISFYHSLRGFKGSRRKNKKSCGPIRVGCP